MNEIKLTFDEPELAFLIEDLLCLEDKGEWDLRTMDSHLVITLQGDVEKVRSKVYKWLRRRR